MTDRPEILACAAALADAWESGRQIDCFPDDISVNSISDGYAIQDLLHSRLGLEQVGWKLYASSAAAMRVTRLSEPLIGRMYRHSLYRQSSITLPASQFLAPTLEPEFLLCFGTDLPTRPEPYVTEDVVAAIASVSLGLEITDSRLVTPKKCGGMAAVTADNTSSGAYIVGPEILNWREIDLETMAINMTAAGDTVATGLTGPSRYVVHDVATWAVNALIARGHTIDANMLMTTGTLTKPVIPTQGTRYCTKFGDFGAISVTLS